MRRLPAPSGIAATRSDRVSGDGWRCETGPGRGNGTATTTLSLLLCEDESMLRRSAGLWGAVAFAGAAVVAARREAGYSHRRHHVSGLAARGHESASIMVPGFVVLATAQAVISSPTPALRRLTRIAAATTFAAGVVQVSDPRCPQPDEADATVSDLGHGAASVVTFGLWMAMPILAAVDERLGWLARLGRVVALPTVVAFVAAGVTTRRNSSVKGLAQRSFLALVFLFLGATGLARGEGRA